MREREITARFGLSHMVLYTLRKAGRIRSVSLRPEGAKQGTRLFHVQSIRDFLSAQEAMESEVAQ